MTIDVLAMQDGQGRIAMSILMTVCLILALMMGLVL